MAALYCHLKKKEKKPNLQSHILTLQSLINEDRMKERTAAIKIQSWYRSLQVQEFIRYLHKCAVVIQRAYKGYIGRSLYRQRIQNEMHLRRQLYYDKMATKIQARWRGYYIRKYKHDFYARKNYLNVLVLKNDMFRETLKKIQSDNIYAAESKRLEEGMAKTLYTNRKMHYLLSTEVCRGVFNSPVKSSPEKELALRTAHPFSQAERDNMQMHERNKFLNTATGIPNTEEVFRRESPVLPPIRTNKPQGPFRSPDEVQKQRYKKLQPSLRVATDFKSVDKSRMQLRHDEWTKRIIDKTFLPSTKRTYTYEQTLHASSSYGRLSYGTKYFRDELQDKNICEKPFQRVVSPIPIFDQLGKTY